jgi:CheY-like chemotaxis protein
MPTILVTEDEFLIQMTLTTWLEDSGYEVLVASSGSEAVAILEGRQAKISALVTDVRLGDGLTGWDVARRARELNPEIAVVYSTGHGINEWPTQGVPNSSMLQKPFAEAQLVLAISSLLDAGARALGARAADSADVSLSK